MTNSTTDKKIEDKIQKLKDELEFWTRYQITVKEKSKLQLRRELANMDVVDLATQTFKLIDEPWCYIQYMIAAITTIESRGSIIRVTPIKTKVYKALARVLNCTVDDLIN